MGTWSKIKEQNILLPVKSNGKIDYSFMESRIRELEESRIRELEAYLEAAGFSDCSLTRAERKALNSIQGGVNCGKGVKIGTLFNIHPTVSYGQTNATLFATKGNTPVIVNSSRENGVGGWVALKPTEKGNMITYSDTTTSDAIFYQPLDYIGYSHVQGLYPRTKNNWDENTYLYFLTTFKKAACGRFDYATKFTRFIAMDMEVTLPSTSGNVIDYTFMDNYINAIKKQCIATLKQEISREHKAYEQAVGINSVEFDTEKEGSKVVVLPEYREGCIPLYTFRAACGKFSGEGLYEEEGWVDAFGNGFTPDPKRHFAIHAKGNSMYPDIKDGDICLFEWYNQAGGTREGEIVLAECDGIDDECTIKKYHSVKKYYEDGSWEHEKIELIPLNKDYDVIKLNSEKKFRIIGIFKCVL